MPYVRRRSKGGPTTMDLRECHLIGKGEGCSFCFLLFSSVYRRQVAHQTITCEKAIPLHLLQSSGIFRRPVPNDDALDSLTEEKGWAGTGISFAFQES
ncbi:hypothetical protein CDAR_259721 [Caerostris darwini]|uniref:Uncharacterized protein n=1 Tax=Caerostris darwini TaxID=1538125 RepID=A0AAV4VNZ2_9ARAC|nr:hypothetical protein CDAR_259721 [Caerostris darwini]